MPKKPREFMVKTQKVIGLIKIHGQDKSSWGREVFIKALNCSPEELQGIVEYIKTLGGLKKAEEFISKELGSIFTAPTFTSKEKRELEETWLKAQEELKLN